MLALDVGGRLLATADVLAAVTERYSLFFLGRHTLESFRDFGILPAFGGVVVSDRYANYFHEGWEHIAGNGEVRQEFSICFITQMLGGTVATSRESSEVRFVSTDDISGYEMHPSI